VGLTIQVFIGKKRLAPVRVGPPAQVAGAQASGPIPKHVNRPVDDLLVEVHATTEYVRHMPNEADPEEIPEKGCRLLSGIG